MNNKCEYLLFIKLKIEKKTIDYRKKRTCNRNLLLEINNTNTRKFIFF